MAVRPIRPEIAIFAIAFFILAALNAPFWRQLHQAVNPASTFEWLFLVSVFVVAFAGYAIVLNAVAFPRIFKPVAVLLVLVAAAASYFIASYGILIDPSMLQNALETDPSEASDLITPDLLLHVAATGVAPAAAIALVPLDWQPLRRALPSRLCVGIAMLVLAAASAAPFSMDYASVFREHRELRFALTPFNVFSSAERLLRRLARNPNPGIAVFGRDARQTRAPGRRRRAAVLVIGETARAANFSLNGYGRVTNPQLQAVTGLINFEQVTSCGTSTAESLPCMFSGLGRRRSSEAALPQEGLLDIVQRAGIAVQWRDNQAGCKGVCARVPTKMLARKGVAAGAESESHDEVLLEGLAQEIDAQREDALIVLHMMGSHGPAYHKRYPAAFQRFTPACQESQFSRCTLDEIVNAYDNTILYTDTVLAKLIEMLRQADGGGVDTAMLYVSDHGESLGEDGLYLHGLPYGLAPQVQKHVPMVLWVSEGLQRAGKLDMGCLAARRSRPMSHDNLFHSVLGLLDVGTTVYARELDIFAACRTTDPTLSEMELQQATVPR